MRKDKTMTETLRNYMGDEIVVSEREREAFRRGRLRGEHDERQEFYNTEPLSGTWAGESIPELLGDLWVDLSDAFVPEWYLATLCDEYEKGYQSAFEDAGRVWCDECCGLVSGDDGVATDAGLAFCGSLRGNGCGDRLIAEGRLPA
jgi:hypothetical protein